MKENDHDNASRRKNRILKSAQAVLWFGFIFSVYQISKSRQEERLYQQKSAPATGRQCLIEHTATLVPNDDLFALENFDWNEKSPCGWNKCFFKLKEGGVYQNNVGYLMLQNDSPEDMWCQYSATKYLETKYNISHLLLGPPQETNISNDFAEMLNKNSFLVIDRPEKKTRYSSRSSIIYERVSIAPNSSLLIGCTGYKLKYISEQWDSFLQTVNQEVFVKTLLYNLQRAKQLLEKEPWVAPDFQLMVDRNGNTYHIDVVAYGIYSRKHVHTELTKCRAAFQKLFRLIRTGAPMM